MMRACGSGSSCGSGGGGGGGSSMAAAAAVKARGRGSQRGMRRNWRSGVLGGMVGHSPLVAGAETVGMMEGEAASFFSCVT